MLVPPITVVGAGQLGGLLAYTMLKMGYNVRVIDSGSKLIRENNQTPWGWLRKFSLQSELKKSILVNEYPITKIDIDERHGPMIITSKNNKTIDNWNKWINKTPDTNSHIFTPKEASKLFNLSEDYFNGKGGVYMLDSRDYLINFSKLNEYVWDYLKSHNNCELIENCTVNSINKDKNLATHLNTNNGDIQVSKLIMCLGNQSQYIINDNVPKLNITLPYAFIKKINDKPFSSIWNTNSSLSYFGNGDIKLACGTQSIFDYNQLNFKNTLHFSRMGLSGLSNLNIGKTNEELINNAIKELRLLGINDRLECYKVQSCDVDLTPNLCPYIYFLPDAKNTLNVTGFSGAGSMIFDPNFLNLLADSIINEKLNKKLVEFQPANNFLKNIFIPDNKKTPLSSII